MTANFSVLYVSHAHTEAAEIADILSEYGLGPQEYGPVVTSLRNNPKAWLEFMMKFELGLEKPEPRRALVSAATIALSYVAGGLVPLLPYMFVPEAGRAMAVSVAVTLAALLFFGFVKGRFTGDRPFFSAVQTTVVGALASAAAYAMARAVQSI
jgi:vacuolar iron transporter family protein